MNRYSETNILKNHGQIDLNNQSDYVFLLRDLNQIIPKIIKDSDELNKIFDKLIDYHKIDNNILVNKLVNGNHSVINMQIIVGLNDKFDFFKIELSEKLLMKLNNIDERNEKINFEKRVMILSDIFNKQNKISNINKFLLLDYIQKNNILFNETNKKEINKILKLDDCLFCINMKINNGVERYLKKYNNVKNINENIIETINKIEAIINNFKNNFNIDNRAVIYMIENNKSFNINEEDYLSLNSDEKSESKNILNFINNKEKFKFIIFNHIVENIKNNLFKPNKSKVTYK